MGWFSQWFGARRREAVLDHRQLDRGVALVVEHTDPRLRFLPGHEKRLREPLQHAMAYLGTLVTQVPGPFAMSRKQWGADPQVNALFGTADDLLDLFGRSAQVQAFWRRHPSVELLHCSIGMYRQEKRVLGMALKEELVRREVAQVAVNFSGHWIGVVAGNEEATREALRWRGLESLCISALERIVALRLGDRELLEERLDQVLEAGCGLDPCRVPGDREVVRRRLTENARRLRDHRIPGGTLEDYLALLVEVLERPEEHLRLTLRRTRVDRMGIKVEEGDGGAEVVTACIERPRQPPFDVILASFPRSEMRDADYYRKRARRYVDAL